jgi:hypothetical protein
MFRSVLGREAAKCHYRRFEQETDIVSWFFAAACPPGRSPRMIPVIRVTRLTQILRDLEILQDGRHQGARQVLREAPQRGLVLFEEARFGRADLVLLAEDVVGVGVKNLVRA